MAERLTANQRRLAELWDRKQKDPDCRRVAELEHERLDAELAPVEASIRSSEALTEEDFALRINNVE